MAEIVDLDAFQAAGDDAREAVTAVLKSMMAGAADVPEQLAMAYGALLAAAVGFMATKDPGVPPEIMAECFLNCAREAAGWAVQQAQEIATSEQGGRA
ncbi:hypothetical protein [Phenylobacterium sp.]|uniref:hypothetical protein n=1 Tax=Phenylobacterium sp. TaxID=1871053 RepID=UPI00391B5B41